jgi:tRNA(Leu) C34 or U34 (ribose-2'-O)-methylase TrmL
MDYLDENMVKIYSSAEEFFDNKKSERIILMTTKAKKNILILNLEKMTLYYLVEKVLVYLKQYIKK